MKEIKKKTGGPWGCRYVGRCHIGQQEKQQEEFVCF